ncbi:DNA-3-methyladenine glycosylase family protein [Aquamicrobium segne]|uniref:DNA-3-methyladenine glycosylase II n=1 Tax=Aquamicrobium segne TaxID=469547 RepID=A0ABW0H5A8_9HYPH
MQRIETEDHIALGLAELCCLDPRLLAVRQKAGEVRLRLSEPGFASLASILVSQQVSRASADAIFARLTALLNPLTPQAVLNADETVFRQAGLSRPKQRSLLATAQAVMDGLDLDGLCVPDAAFAHRQLTEISGIGTWTADCYLLFCAGHPDIFPARDVALQSAVGHAFSIEPRPDEKALLKIAEAWRPWRGVAARLFWAYYREWKGREAAPPA